MRFVLMAILLSLTILSGLNLSYADDITLTGQVWLDTDADGLFDSNESPLSDCAIMANRSYSTQTAQDGTYLLTVPAGLEYRITALCDANWIQTCPLAAQDYRYGGTGVLIPDNGDSIEVTLAQGDPNGNLYVAGYFNGTVDFDPSSAGVDRLSSQSGRVFVTKFNADQSYAWTVTVPNTAYPPADLAVSDQAVFLVGKRYSTSHGYITHMDPNGSLEWMHSFQYVFPSAVCIAPNQDIYIAGSFKKTVDFDPNEDSDHSQEAISYYGDLFMLGLTFEGEFQWVETMGYSKNAVAGSQRIRTDSEGNIYLAGYLSNGGSNYIDMDPGPGEALYSTNGDKDGFISKYLPDRTYVWTFKLSSSFTNQPYDMEIDALDRITVAGVHNGRTTFGLGGPAQRCDPGAAEAFVFQLDPNGSLNWLETLNDASVGVDMSHYDAAATGLCIDRFNDIHIVGERVYDAELLKYESFYGGDNDLFIWHLNSNGENQDFDILNGLSETPSTGEYGYYNPLSWDIAFDALGDLQICGRFSYTADLAPGSISEVFHPQGDADGFVMTLEHLHGLYLIDASSGSQSGLDFGLWNVNAVLTDLIDSNSPSDSNAPADSNSPPIDVVPVN